MQVCVRVVGCECGAVRVAIMLALVEKKDFDRFVQNCERGGKHLIAGQHEGLSSVIASMRFVSMHACVCVFLKQK